MVRNRIAFNLLEIGSFSDIGKVGKQWNVSSRDLTKSLIVSDKYTDAIVARKLSVADIGAIAGNLTSEDLKFANGILVDKILSPFMQLDMSEDINLMLDDVDDVELKQALTQSVDRLIGK
jgi:hypothetical protein